MNRIVNLYEAKTHLSSLVEEAAGGEDIVIAKNGKPRAILKAIPEDKPQRRPGQWKGRIWIGDDFDDPLPDDIQAAFEGRDPDDPLNQ